ncbi:hypothetical protein JXA88_02385 [Candidatus Fermentibacteria bacterium]|nr:hypothetical protein [Candidatus Fermentibacteria bacterium]
MVYLAPAPLSLPGVSRHARPCFWITRLHRVMTLGLPFRHTVWDLPGIAGGNAGVVLREVTGEAYSRVPLHPPTASLAIRFSFGVSRDPLDSWTVP